MTDNVTPIAPTDPPCASCGAVIRVADRYDPEKHDERCRQPEIRMRRVEGELAALKDVLYQLVGQGNETVQNQVDLNKRLVEMQVVIDRHSELVTQLTRSLEHAVDNAGQVTLILKAHAERIAVLEGCLMTGAWAHRSFPDAVLDERQREVRAQMDEARARLSAPDKPQ